MIDRSCRPIKSDLKSHRIVPEKEKPSRWSFLKVLREYSTLKEFYPEINPYAEAYKFRDNMYAIFTEGLTAFCGDMWNYLIIGPEKAMLIDTGFGAGNLRALCDKLSGGKEIICVNTHFHLDHIGGNGWFDKVYCHEYDKKYIEESIYPEFITSQTLDKDGKPKETYYDPADLPPFHKYEVIGVPDGYVFNLGGDYEVKLVHLPGHTPGQSGFWDKQNKCFFIGDTTSAMPPREGEPHPECCSVLAIRDAMSRALEEFGDQIGGVFPGHGTIDLHAISLQYLVDACNLILKNPENYDSITTFGNRRMMAKFIYQQGSDMKYTDDSVR
ncbi:MAG: MBL fold metallo-hydrolase [Erysipelotrichaceae bacterium]|nr:MBL fold metallo-hydrolase [Erysipelotrichaceae bacterium]